MQDNNNCRNYVTQDSLVSNVTPHVGKTNTVIPEGLPLTFSPMENIKNRHSMSNFDNLSTSIYSPEILEEPKRQIMDTMVIQPLGKYLSIHPELYDKIPPMFFDETPKMEYIA